MNEQDRLDWWREYIDLIGSQNFELLPNNRGPWMIRSPFYSGMDCSEADGGEYIFEVLRERYRSYHEIVDNSGITRDRLEEAFLNLDKNFMDVELCRFIEGDMLNMSDTEFWDAIVKIWSRQEFNGAGGRRSRWRKILSHRPRQSYLTRALPASFVAYRAGDLDGFSWTLNRDVAKWFYDRFKNVYGFSEIHLLQENFIREDAVFYTNNRNEEEVVILKL
jgi:hypothetical protein